MGNFYEKENEDIYDDISKEIDEFFFDIDKEIQNNFSSFFKNDNSLFERNEQNYRKTIEIKKLIKFSMHNTINKIYAFLFNKYIIDLIKKNSIQKDISLKKIIA